MGLHGRGGEREEKDETCHEKWVERTTELLPFCCATWKWPVVLDWRTDSWRMTGSPLLPLSAPGDAVISILGYELIVSLLWDWYN